ADVARNTLAAVQTPQVFRKDLLRRALTSAAERGYSFTDDCAAVESLGTIVKATHGSYQNIKITTPEDILVAEALLTREDK
ncbi:MAG: 2-C-methyl-D-erythritol 4-phosphate cytidylyltransferase, partial [Agathobaculum butyriciproducens]